MERDELSRQGEPDPRARLRPRVPSAAVEPVEDAREILVGDSGAVVGDLDDEPPGLGARSLSSDNDRNGSVAAVGVLFADGKGDDVRMAEIDERLDNGVLTTGGFRKKTDNIYVHITE